jgi:hypothetical protein
LGPVAVTYPSPGHGEIFKSRDHNSALDSEGFLCDEAVGNTVGMIGPEKCRLRQNGFWNDAKSLTHTSTRIGGRHVYGS